MSQPKNLKPLFQPKCIAVVGASERYGAGSLVIENLITLGFKGKIIPINPKYSTVLGLKCFPSIIDAPVEHKIDCVAIVLGHKQTVSVIRQAAQRRISGAWAFASGFAETGDEGALLQEELRKLCNENDIMFCGPNCVGYINLHENVGTFSAPISPTLKKGKIGAVAQSGSVILALSNSNRGIGFSTLISSGNEAVLDMADYIEYLVGDKNTEVIVAFLEGIRRPKEFMDICERAAERKKPVITVKVGRSLLAQQTVITHTGALAGSDDIYDALFKHLGVIRVDDLDQLLETAEAFVRCKNNLPKGNRVGAITVSGGEIGLMGDLAENRSFSFPPLPVSAQKQLRDRLPPFTPIGNPLDAWGSGDLAGTYPVCLDILAMQKDIDLIAISQDAPRGMAEKQIKQYVDVAKSAVKTTARGKPIIVFSHVSGGLDPTIKKILDKGNIPFLQGTHESLMAIDKLIEYGKFQQKRHRQNADEPLSSVPPQGLMNSLKGKRRVLTFTECKKVIDAYGIPFANTMVVETVQQAVAASHQIGYPIALKGQSTQITHKTEADLVRLNIHNRDELQTAFLDIQKNMNELNANPPHEGILIQEMIPPEAVEVILGISRDPSFGPVLVVGMGGVFVELLKDACTRFPPIGPDDAREMIHGLKGRTLLDGFRGKPPADIDSLIRIIGTIGRMAVELKNVLYALDLNPLMVLPNSEGAYAVDIVMEVGDQDVSTL